MQSQHSDSNASLNFAPSLPPLVPPSRADGATAPWGDGVGQQAHGCGKVRAKAGFTHTPWEEAGSGLRWKPHLRVFCQRSLIPKLQQLVTQTKSAFDFCPLVAGDLALHFSPLVPSIEARYGIHRYILSLRILW